MAGSGDAEYCEALVREHDKDRWLASLFVPAQRREFLLALYAFNLEISHVSAVVRDPMAGAIRLQWWREAIEGVRAAEAAASPVAAAIRAALNDTRTDPAPLIELIEMHRAELFGTPLPPTEPAIFLTAARFLAGEHELLRPAAESAGLAYALSHDPPQAAEARGHYDAFTAIVKRLPAAALPAFLPAALVPLRIRRGTPAQWRRQVALLRAAWFGFPDR